MGRRGLVMVCVLVMVAAAACSAPQATLEATPTSSSPTATTATVEAAPTEQPGLEELYRPRAFCESTRAERVTPTGIPPPSIEAANAEAEFWQHGYEAPKAPPSFEGPAGSAEPRCVEVDSHGRVRSGGFLLDATLWGNGRPMLGLEAADAASVGNAYAAVLTVRLLSLDATRTTRVIEVRGRAADDEARRELPFGIERTMPRG